MRSRGLAVGIALAIAGVVAPVPGAEAAIKKYRLIARTLTTSPLLSPNADVVIVDTEGNPVTYVDDSGVNPRLIKYKNNQISTATVDLSNEAGPGAFIFLSSIQTEGPAPLVKQPVFTGTGNTAAGMTIRWGIVTGWTVTGAFFCNSSPPVICALGGFVDDTTVDPNFTSDFYDLGTWSFHGTGFTAIPYVQAFHTTDFGNDQSTLQGFRIIDFSVPALPLVGIVLLGGSLVLGGATALRRIRGDR